MKTTTYALELPSKLSATGWMRWQEFPSEAQANDAGEEMELGDHRVVEINHSEETR